VDQILLPSLIFGSLTPGLKTNDDGSVEVFVDPAAPAGLETNRVKSVRGKARCAYFLFAPHPNPFSNRS
jgi:hypothetical protein